MLLHVIARGKIARSPEEELVERYAKRIQWPLKLTELPETGGRIPDPQTPFSTVLLDERGKNLAPKNSPHARSAGAMTACANAAS